MARTRSAKTSAKRTSADDALLAAVLAAPKDDAPRLVHADALLERGDPRGELIQLQCELARVDEDDARWHRMKHRERALLKLHKETWTKDVCALGKHLDVELHRGFIEKARGTSDELAKIGAKLLAAAPLLRELDVICYERSIDDLIQSDIFARVQTVRIMGGRRVDLSALGSLATPLPLRRLHLDEVSLVKSDVEAIVRSPALARLRELEFSRCTLGKDSPAPLEALSTPLERFELSSGKHPEALVRALVHGPAFASLEALLLCNNPLGDDALAHLIAAHRFHGLEEVDLRSNGLSAKAISKLLAALPTQGVRRLLLGGNELSDAVATEIAAWSGASGLTKLDLGSDKIGNTGARALANSPRLAKLRSLVLSNCKVSAATEKILLASPHLANSRLYVGERFLKRE